MYIKTKKVIERAEAVPMTDKGMSVGEYVEKILAEMFSGQDDTPGRPLSIEVELTEEESDRLYQHFERRRRSKPA